MKVLDWYYKTWVDGIIIMRSVPNNKFLWKFYVMVFMTMAMFANLLTIITIIQRTTGTNFYSLHIHFFKDPKINSHIDFFICFLLLPLLINYFLIFRNNRYEILITKYKFYGGKLFLPYTVLSYIIPFIIIFLVAISQ
jgi:hypothetical protein